MSREVIDKYIAGGLSALQRMEQASLHAPEVSLETLKRLIRQNEDTEYGRKYDFRSIHSYEDYARKVPLSEYSDYEPYIERMVRFGDKKLITASDIQYFAHTSGTSGASKMIPRTKEELDILFTDIFMRAFGLRERTLAGKKGIAEKDVSALDDILTQAREHIPRYKGVNFMETQTGLTLSGIAHGAISETLNHPMDTAICSVFPKELIYTGADYDRKHVKLLFALRERHLSYLMSTFSPMMYDMIAYLQQHWKELCEDLEEGKIRSDVSVERRLRFKLNAMLKPDPVRANEIRNIMSEFGNEAFIPRIWPDLSMVACIGTADFAPYMNKIRQHLGPNVAVDYLGYVASESTVAAQINEGEEAYMLLPYSGFYEFIPIEEETSTSGVPCSAAEPTSGVPRPPVAEPTSGVPCSAAEPTSGVLCPGETSTSGVPRPLLMDQLEMGREYELVITNLSGFYRYRIGDVIRVTGFHNQSPMIVFSYRKKQLVSMYGEKITESVMHHAITKLAEESGTIILEYSIYPDADSDPGHYVVLLESDEEISPDRWSHYSETLNRLLCEAHDSYRQKIEKKTMLPLEVRFVQPQTYALYRDLKVMEGASPNQIKPLHVINDDKLRRFFFALVQK